MNKIFYKHYVFLDKIDDVIKDNLLKFKSINIIIDVNKNNGKNFENSLSLIEFARKNSIPFLIKNDFQKSTKFNANGVFISSDYKKITKPILLKKNFSIVGGAHNQLEYTQKFKQKCQLLMLSPLFLNEKYSKNKILSVLKFNIKTLQWNIDLCALGGINAKTLKKVKLTRCRAIGFVKAIYNSKIKKPAYNLM